MTATVHRKPGQRAKVRRPGTKTTTSKEVTMIHEDDGNLVPSLYRPSHDPWGEPAVAPTTDHLRQLIRNAIARHPNHSPTQIKVNLFRDEGVEALIGEICGVKAGM